MSDGPQHQHASIRGYFAAAALYAVILLLLFHRLFLGEILTPAANIWDQFPFRDKITEDVTPYLNGIQGDVWRQFEPWRYHQFESLRQGRIPLWNPHIYGGFPVLANAQSALFSPFHLIYYLIHPAYAAGLVAGLKLWTAAFGTFCFARRLGLSDRSAFMAGTVWMLCGFNVRWLFWNHTASTAWFPWMLLCLDRLVVLRTARSLGATALVATCLQLAGHPESQFHVGALCGLYVLVRFSCLRQPLATAASSLGLCLLAMILGVLGASAALLPFAEQLVHSADWLESLHSLKRWLPWQSAIGWFLPDHYGRPRAGWSYHPSAEQLRMHLNYVETGIYVGVLPWALACAAIVRSFLRGAAVARSVSGPLVAITLFCGAVSFGLPGVFDLVQVLPGFAKADNLRLALGMQFGMAMLSGVCISYLLNGDARAQQLTRLFLLIALAVAAPVFANRHWAAFSEVLWGRPYPHPLEHSSVRAAASLATVIITFVLLWIMTVRRWVGVGGLLLVGLATSDLFWVSFGFNPTVPPRFVFPDMPREFTQVLATSRTGRIVATDEILTPNLGLTYGYKDLRGYDFPLDVRWTRFYRELGWKDGITLMPNSAVARCIPNRLASVLSKCAVSYVIVKSDSDSLGRCEDATRSWDRVYTQRSASVYRNNEAYPRVYFAREAVPFAGTPTVDCLFDPELDFRDLSYVETGSLERIPRLAGDSRSEIVLDIAEEVIVKAESESGGLLVLSDRYDSNWTVTIDGAAAEPIRVNYLFRGVVVPPGKHEVHWRYQPICFKIGVVLSIVTFVAILGLILKPAQAIGMPEEPT